MKIPEWEEVSEKVARGESLSDIESVVYHGETWGDTGKVFRSCLQSVIDSSNYCASSKAEDHHE